MKISVILSALFLSWPAVAQDTARIQVVDDYAAVLNGPVADAQKQGSATWAAWVSSQTKVQDFAIRLSEFAVAADAAFDKMDDVWRTRHDAYPDVTGTDHVAWTFPKVSQSARVAAASAKVTPSPIKLDRPFTAAELALIEKDQRLRLQDNVRIEQFHQALSEFEQWVSDKRKTLGDKRKSLEAGK